MRRPPPALGLALTIVRTVQGWKQWKLAAAVGTTRSVISNQEKGSRRIVRQELAAYAARMGFDLGRRAEAVAGLEEVVKAFAGRQLPYDTALATLDLAALYLEDGRTAEVKALAARMIAIFAAQKVGREAHMALETFERAARAERATAELVRRLARYLEQSRHDPRLRFRA